MRELYDGMQKIYRDFLYKILDADVKCDNRDDTKKREESEGLASVVEADGVGGTISRLTRRFAKTLCASGMGKPSMLLSVMLLQTNISLCVLRTSPNQSRSPTFRVLYLFDLCMRIPT